MKNFLLGLIGALAIAVSMAFILAAVLVYYWGPTCVLCILGAFSSFFAAGLCFSSRD